MTAMLAAELLKLRRNRAVTVGGLLVAVGGPVAILLMTWVVSPDRVGGIDRTEATMAMLIGPGLFAAALIGIAGGAADREAGVLRSLAGTGVPRATLFWVRIPAVVLAATVVGVGSWAVACATGAVIHVGTPPVTAAWALAALPAVVVANVVVALATLGLCTAGLAGGPVLGLVLALTLGAMPVLASSDRTPDWLFGLMPPIAVTELVGGQTIVGSVPIPVGWAAVGLLAWVAGALTVGALRFRRAEL